MRSRHDWRLSRGVVYYGSTGFYGPGWTWFRARLASGRAVCPDPFDASRVLFDVSYEQARLMHYMHCDEQLATDDAREWRRGCLWLVDVSPTYERFRAQLVEVLARQPELFLACNIITRHTEMMVYGSSRALDSFRIQRRPL